MKAFKNIFVMLSTMAFIILTILNTGQYYASARSPIKLKDYQKSVRNATIDAESLQQQVLSSSESISQVLFMFSQSKVTENSSQIAVSSTAGETVKAATSKTSGREMISDVMLPTTTDAGIAEDQTYFEQEQEATTIGATTANVEGNNDGTGDWGMDLSIVHPRPVYSLEDGTKSQAHEATTISAGIKLREPAKAVEVSDKNEEALTHEFVTDYTDAARESTTKGYNQPKTPIVTTASNETEGTEGTNEKIPNIFVSKNKGHSKSNAMGVTMVMALVSASAALNSRHV